MKYDHCQRDCFRIFAAPIDLVFPILPVPKFSIAFVPIMLGLKARLMSLFNQFLPNLSNDASTAESFVRFPLHHLPSHC